MSTSSAFERRLQRELLRRRVEHREDLVALLAAELCEASFEEPAVDDAPEDVLTRLGRT